MNALSRLYEHRRALMVLFLLACLGLLVAQNMEPVELRFAFFSVKMPRFASVAAGVVVGVLIGLALRGKRPPAEKAEAKGPAPEHHAPTRKMAAKADAPKDDA